MTSPTFPSFDSDDFGDIIVDSAMAYQDGVPISVTRNALSFDPQEEWENYPFPGKTMPVVDLDEVVRSRPVIRGTMMMSGEAQFLVYRPGGSWGDAASAGGIITTGARAFTPGAFRTPLSRGVYIPNLMVIWKRQRGDFLAVTFEFAMCTKYGISSNDNDEGMIAVEFEARQANDGTPSTSPPYTVTTVPPEFTVPDTPPDPPPESDAPMIADWAMSEGSGSTVADDSP